MPRQLLWISIGVVMSSMGVLETNSAHSTVVRTPEFMSSRRLEESGLDRDLEDIPDDVSICDEYFFGRATSLPSDQIPFCVNNGICQASWVNDPRQPCQCLDAYAGPHCEFAADQVPNVCHLGCRNGGTCALGASSWQHYHRNDGGWTDPFDLQHCECTKGYTGLICEQQGTPCGDDRCHNGGTCVLTSDSDGSNKYSCDCTTAKNSDGVSVFAGQYCEHEATSVCSDQNANQFCVNGGTCRSDSLGCICPTGYVGPVCEFKDLGQETVECKLSCENHGICRKGAKDVSDYTKFGVGSNSTLTHNEDFEHCVCPTGYVGLQCEYQLDQCPGGTHACLNGGECISLPNGSKVSYACDCTNAETTVSRFAGGFCEMESTQFCTIDGGKSHLGVGIDSFCTNGGKCPKYVQYFEEHPGCDCPKEFDGENCQYVVDTAKEGPDLVVVMAAILAVASVLSAGLLLKIRRRRSQIKLYDQVEPSALPPTLDIIRSLGHDREAEFTEGSLQNSKAYKRSTTVSVQSTEDLVMMRKSYWPAVKDGCASNPIHIFNDVELDDEVIRPPRKTYWPNDAQFDASNPSYVFDDISVRSEALDSSSRSNSSGSDYNESVSDGSDEHKTIV